jgi:hypothetical protein
MGNSRRDKAGLAESMQSDTVFLTMKTPINPNAEYVVKNGKRTAVILPLAEYEALLEDLDDLSVIASRKDEPTISLEQVKRRLKKHAAVRR